MASDTVLTGQHRPPQQPNRRLQTTLAHAFISRKRVILPGDSSLLDSLQARLQAPQAGLSVLRRLRSFVELSWDLQPDTGVLGDSVLGGEVEEGPEARKSECTSD